MYPWEFKASLVYRARSRTAMTVTQGNPVSKNQNQIRAHTVKANAHDLHRRTKSSKLYSDLSCERMNTPTNKNVNKQKLSQAEVAHTFNPSTQEAGQANLNSRPAWSTGDFQDNKGYKR